MNNLNFPTTIIDNFFDDPDSIVKFANTLEFKRDPRNVWPGTRTEQIVDINPTFFHITLNKFFNLYCITERQYTVDMRFQKIEKKYGKGWVHTDDAALLTSIVYLTKNASPNSGTSIFKPKTIGCSLINGDKKVDFYSGKIDSDDFFRNENNDQFEESIIVKNQYNRLFSFEGNSIHSANDFDDDERLTLIWFLRDYHQTMDRTPIQRMKTTPITLEQIKQHD